jgi:uncharacterized Fe-S cluster protein YjdI
MKNITKKYDNGEITVIWQPGMCSHSAKCFHGLPSVFDPRKKPWVTPEGGTTEEIIRQVEQCPSGALSYIRNDGNVIEEKSESIESETIIEPLPNGPLLVYGTVHIRHGDNEPIIKHKVTAFCRCGASSNKPFCDGTHTKIGFHG